MLFVDVPCPLPPYEAPTSFCQLPNVAQPIPTPTRCYSPALPPKNGLVRHADSLHALGGDGGIPPYNTITSSTFKVHQHPLTYNGLGTLPITATVRDTSRDRYATIAAGGSTAFGQSSATGGYVVRFPAHCAALQGFHSRTADGGYFTDDRQLSDGDSGSPAGSP